MAANARLIMLLRQLSRSSVRPDAIECAAAEAVRQRGSNEWPPDAAAERIGRAGVAEFGSARLAASPSARPGDRDQRRVRLRVQGVSKRYRRREVLHDITMTVRAGEVVAIVGANGAGKSTLLKICAGLTRPSRGTVLRTLDLYAGGFTALLLVGWGVGATYLGLNALDQNLNRPYAHANR